MVPNIMTRKTNHRNKTIPIVIALSAGLALGGAVRAAFLLDEEAPARVEKAEKAPVAKPASEFPPHIATNIKAQPVAGVRGAIRVSWDADPTAPNDFIVGRSSEAPDTFEKALAAKSIKILPAAMNSSVIDSNLPPGRYYYVVLARERVMSREIEIYPDVNYTVNPVILEREEPLSGRPLLPDQVTLIYARVVNQTQVALSWKGVSGQGISYNVYRGTAPLSSPEKIRGAERVAVVTDRREAYTDRGITATGTYYYAVSTSDMAGNEDLQLIPEQSYMTKGVFVAFISEATVSGLRARPEGDGSVRLTWKGIGSSSVEYLVYRYDRPITDVQRLALAAHIGVVQADESEFTDASPGQGANYYAVLVRLRDSSIDNTIKEGSNCTLDPVSAGRAPVTRKRPAARMEPPPGKETPRRSPVETGTVDAVLRETFFRERYPLALRRLEEVARSSTNEAEVAKARLFMGRSLVEMRRYRKAIDYFLMPDVRRHFPKEVEFWREYAISRTR